MADFKLKWDQTAEKLYETGTDRGVLYPYNSAAEDPAKAYGPGVVWNGITAFTETPSGAESNPLYADNIKYLNLRSVEDFGATLEAYTYPDEFAECNGEKYPGTGNKLMKIGQQARKTFGLCVRTRVGNDVDLEEFGYDLHLVYGATASPSERNYQTINDSPDAITFSWDIDTVPVDVPDDWNAKPCASVVVHWRNNLTAQEKAKIEALEAKLYGTPASGEGQSAVEATDAYLPLPEEVYNTLYGT